MTFQDNNQPPTRPPLDLNQQLPGRIDPGTGQPDRPAYQPHQPAARRAPLYIPASTNYEPQDWAKPNAFINAAASYPGVGGYNMPSPEESYPLLASSTGQLARMSAPDVSAPANRASQAALSFAPLLDIISKGAFSANFNASSLAAIKRRQQQMLLDIDEARQTHEAMMLDFSQIYNAYDTAGRTGPHSISPEEAEQDLIALARKYRWDMLEYVIGTQGLEAGRQFLKKQHATYLDMIAGQTTLKKATGADEDAEIGKEWGLDPNDITRGGSGVTSGTGSFFAGGPSQSAPESTQAPRRPDLSDYGSDFNAGYGRQNHLSPQQMRAIQEEVDTGKTPSAISMLEKQKGGEAKNLALGRHGQGVTDLNNRIDKISNDPNLSYDDKMRQIEQINPGVAGHLRGLLGLDLDPKETAVANRGVMARRAEAISRSQGSLGQFTQGKYDEAKKFEAANQKINTRASTMAESALNVWGTLNLTSEKDSNLVRKAEAYIAGELTGDDYRYKQIFDALADYANHFYGVESGTGTPRVGPMRDWLNSIGAYSSPWQIRAAITQNLSAAYGFIDTNQRQWERIKPNTLMPYIDKEHYGALRAILRANIETGQMPSDAPGAALAVSRDPSEARKDANKDPPLTMKQIRAIIPKIEEYEANPTPENIQRARNGRRRIGHIIGIERYIPELDTPDAAPNR